MDKDLKARWVAALRSGEYTQGRARLRSAVNTYCCLGVLCEVMGEPAVSDVDGYLYDGQSLWLSDGLVDESGISNAGHSECMRLNDAEKASFADIASYIEREL